MMKTLVYFPEFILAICCARVIYMIPNWTCCYLNWELTLIFGFKHLVCL